MSAGEPSALDLRLREPLEFEFTLAFKLDEHDALVDAVLQRLDTSGCPDSVVGAGVIGLLELQFVCKAISTQAALDAATACVLRAFPSALLVRIEPAQDTPDAGRSDGTHPNVQTRGD